MANRSGSRWGASVCATRGWVVLAGAALIFLVVLGLTARAVLSPAAREARSGRFLIIGGGIVCPVVALSVLLAADLVISARTAGRADGEPLRIEVVGERWWWRVRYPGKGGPDVVTANEIRIPAGRPVEFALSTADVIHSFWAPNLAGKMDMIPGRTNLLRLRADAPGVYRGQCAEERKSTRLNYS